MTDSEGSEHEADEEQEPAIPPAVARRLEGAFGESAAVVTRRLAERTGQSPQDVVTAMGYMFMGPCPPPEMLAAYEAIEPGMADRILRQGESQTAHRQEMESKLLDFEHEDRKEARSQSRLGLYLGAAVVALGFATAIVMAALGYEVLAGLFGAGDIALLVGVFVYGSRGQKGLPPRPSQDDSG